MKLLALIILGLILSLQSALAADMERAKQLVEEKCHLCHGMEGEGSSAIYPRIAAQHKEYMIKQLSDFRDGKRQGTMNEMAAGLSDEDIVVLAEYFSAKKPLVHKVRDSDLAAVGKYIYHKGNRYSEVPPCASCHGDNGGGTKQMPRLAGQHKRYVVFQLQEFNQRKRTNDNAIMHSIASNLTELEIQAVSLYVSGMQ